MHTNIKATNITLSPAISDYIEKKIQMLEKFFQKMEDVLVSVEVGKTTRHHKSGDIFMAEIRITAHGQEYYAVREMEDLYAAIDAAKDAIQHELTSKRKRALRLFKKGGVRLKNLLKGFGERGSRIKSRFWKREK